MALDNQVVTLHTKVRARWHSVNTEGQPFSQIVDSTPGRLMVAQYLPKHHMVPFSMINKLLTKKEISKILDVVYRH